MVKNYLYAIVTLSVTLSMVPDAQAAGTDMHIGNTTTLSDIRDDVGAPVYFETSTLSWSTTSPKLATLTVGYTPRELPTLNIRGALLKHIWVEAQRVTGFAVLPPSVAVNSSLTSP